MSSFHIKGKNGHVQCQLSKLISILYSRSIELNNHKYLMQSMVAIEVKNRQSIS